jgi:hypothetical protein
MRKIVIGCLAFALVPTALPAQAETTSPGQNTSQPRRAQERPARDSAADSNRQICVTEALSGSRMPRRVCHTAREWELLQNGPDDR